MTRGQRMPDIIATELDMVLDKEVHHLKYDLLLRIKESALFLQLIQSSHGAKREDYEQLAHALLEAKLTKMPIAHLIETYAQRFIYTERIKPSVLINKTRTQ
jgi:hypothetical protein